MGKILYTPRPKEFTPPDVPAGDYRIGSIWESDDGSRWVSGWSSERKAFVWNYIDPFADLAPGGMISVTYSFEQESR